MVVVFVEIAVGLSVWIVVGWNFGSFGDLTFGCMWVL